MTETKKINLLPIEIKRKYANKYLKYFAVVVAFFMIMAVMVQFACVGILHLQINYYNDKNEKYEEMKKDIEALENQAASYEMFIKEYETSFFPFERFMNTLEEIKPESVRIISVDTEDRLVNEGGGTEEGTDKSAKGEKTEENEETEETRVNENVIGYKEDLAGKNIILRGYGKKQNDISLFIYEISKIPYITRADITAIEEHEMYDGQIYNIFEIIVQGGTDIENHTEG